MREAFLDTNVLIDFLWPEHEDHHQRAVRLFHEVEAGQLRLHLAPTTIFEAAYVFDRVYHSPRQQIADVLTNLLALSGLVLPERTDIITTIGLWARESPLSFADCYHLVLAESLGLDAIYSFDRKMGRYPGVARLEP